MDIKSIITKIEKEKREFLITLDKLKNSDLKDFYIGYYIVKDTKYIQVGKTFSSDIDRIIRTCTKYHDTTSALRAVDEGIIDKFINIEYWKEETIKYMEKEIEQGNRAIEHFKNNF